MQLKDAGNSLFVVDHEMDLVRKADWIVDIGPGAGDAGGSLIYSGPVPGWLTLRIPLLDATYSM